MVSELNLSGNELLCYALIYGFSQDGESVFSSSSKYISEWLNVSQKTVFSLLQRLIEKNLIEKVDKIVNGVRLCDYKATSYPMKKLQYPYEDSSYHNNIYNNKKENNNINIIIKEKKENTGSKNKEPVVEFGECKRVRLSQTQYNNLKSKYKNIDEAIEILDTYLGCKQDSKYNNNHDHYSFFKTNSWVWNNVKYGKPVLNEVKLPNGLTEKENEDRIKFLLDGGVTMEQLEKLGAL